AQEEMKRIGGEVATGDIDVDRVIVGKVLGGPAVGDVYTGEYVNAIEGGRRLAAPDFEQDAGVRAGAGGEHEGDRGASHENLVPSPRASHRSSPGRVCHDRRRERHSPNPECSVLPGDAFAHQLQSPGTAHRAVNRPCVSIGVMVGEDQFWSTIVVE